jgi:hypothetical protein
MAKTITIAAGAAALAVVGLLGAGLSGCSGSVKVGSTAPSVSAADLQKNLTDQFSSATPAPKTVTCTEDLAGEVGKKATCDVMFSDTNSVQAVVTVNSVDGSTVNYDITPALSQDQLQQAVSGLDSTPTVSCDSGLDGTVGAMATCEVTVNGATSKRRVTVDGVDGLELDLTVASVASKQQVQDLLMQKLASDGQPAEAVACVDDVVAKEGMSVECTITSGGQTQPVVVTVTSADGDNIEFDYSAKP